MYKFIIVNPFPFSDNILLDQTESFKSKNVQLTVEVERLRQENLDLQVKLETGYVFLEMVVTLTFLSLHMCMYGAISYCLYWWVNSFNSKSMILSWIIFRGGASGGKGGEKTQALEQKVFKLQEELTELHRRRGEVNYLLLHIQRKPDR